MSERETEGLIAQAVPWSQAQPLLPCPFCGQRVSIRKGVNSYGHCKTEGCYANRAQIIPLDDAKQVDAWNRRDQPTAPALEATARVRAYLARHARNRHGDPRSIHGYDIGEASEAELLVADLEALTAAPVREESGVALARALKSLKALQEGAALAMPAFEENEAVYDFLCAIHREAVKGQLASDEVINEPALATREEAQAEAGEDAAWMWLNSHVECDPADRDYSADEMVDAFMAGQSSRRAQTQAREDAQPVAYDERKLKKGDQVWIRATVTDPCTSCCGVSVKSATGSEVHRYIAPADVRAHPAPDALRDIVQRCVNALDASRNGGEFPDFELWEADARQALAALQAEVNQ